MKVEGFDGREYSWNLTKTKKRQKPSSLHLRARELLVKLYPCSQIVEELTLPGSKVQSGNPLHADFFIPSLMIMIEVQGEQHYKFNNFHFQDRMSFLKAQARDKKKQEWCDLNDILLVQLPFNEDDNDWTKRIKS